MANITTAQAGNWNAGTTWVGGVKPGVNDRAVINHSVVLTANESCSGVRINSTGTLTWLSSANVQLTSKAIYAGADPDWTGTTGGVDVRGTLRMRPDDTHTAKLIFTDIIEGRFVGGTQGAPMTTEPKDPDIGLWCFEGGKLDIEGETKVPFAKASTTISAGAVGVSLTLGVGHKWKVGDTIVITPTAKNDYTNFEERVITAITPIGSGNISFIEWTGGLAVSHPEVPWPTSWTSDAQWADHIPIRAEVLNITRNVVIGGAANARTHTFVSNSSPVVHTVKYCRVDQTGPRKASKEVLGRWAIHFHHSMGNNAGSLVEGVVTYHADAHAYVPHNADGILFKKCIAYDGQLDAFWWDKRDLTNNDGITRDTLWEDCISAKLTTDVNNFLGSLRHFTMADGGADGTLPTGNIVRRCIGVGIYDGPAGPIRDFSGAFGWRESGGGRWLHEDCIAHNNAQDGMIWWVNPKAQDTVTRFLSVRNGGSGTDHGAYGGTTDYIDCVFFDNGTTPNAGIAQHATGSRLSPPIVTRYLRCFIGSTIAPALRLFKHVKAYGQAWVFDHCRFDSPTPILYTEDVGPQSPPQPSYHAYTNCLANGVPLDFTHITQTNVADGTIIQIGSLIGGAQVFTIPDKSEVAADELALAKWYQTDIDIIRAGVAGQGVVSGCAVTPGGGMIASVASGEVRIGPGNYQTIAAGTLNVAAADATNDRLDMVVVNASGVKSIVQGTASASPLMPDIGTNVGLAVLLVKAAATSVPASKIISKRFILDKAAPVNFPAVGSSGARQYTMPGVSAVDVATQALAADIVYYYPIYVDTPTVFTKIAFLVDVAAAAGKTARVGLYTANGSLQPEVLVADCGTIAVDTTGNKLKDLNVASPSTGLKLEGHYLLAITTDGAPTLRGVRGSCRYVSIQDSPTAGSSQMFNSQFRVAQVYTAFADPGVEWITKTEGSTPPFNGIYLR